MTTCLFCRIAAGTAPSRPVYGDDMVYAFRDINPQAPDHVLVIPRKHISTLNDLSPEDDAVMGQVVRRASLIARELGHAERGYRVVINCNAAAGQSVFHVHLHLLAGRRFRWPPG